MASETAVIVTATATICARETTTAAATTAAAKLKRADFKSAQNKM